MMLDKDLRFRRCIVSSAAAASGVSLANAITPDPAPTVGELPYRYECQDRDGNWVFRGSCGPTGDLGDTGAVIPSGQPLSIGSFAYRASV